MITDFKEYGNKVMGAALTPVHTVGSLEFLGEMWDAISETQIPSSARGRVKRALLEIERI